MKNTNHFTLKARHSSQAGNGFTMAELVVVITILVILSAIGFSSYSGHLGSARDTQRKSDISQIEASLKNYKLKRGYYSDAGDSFDISYKNEVLAKQGLLNNNVKLTTLDTLPKDPKANRFYSYSTTKNKQEFQIAATLENSGEPMALLKGNYKSVSKNILPTIMLATSSSIDISSNSGAFIFDGQGDNLPYTINGGGVKSLGVDITSETNNNNFWQNTDFRTCAEIKEGGKILLENTELEYQILNDSGSLINITCSGSNSF